MNVKEKLEAIAGKENVLDDPNTLVFYSQDQSLTPHRKPDYVVKVKEKEVISEVLKFANEERIPVIPLSSSIHFYGFTVPHQGGIVLDLSGLDRILEIDEENRKLKIEPGVTWGKLQEELEKKGFMALPPLLPHLKRSVIADYLEREVLINPSYDYGEPLLAMEVIWPTGEVMRTGSASTPTYPSKFAEGANPTGPGTLDFYRFLQGSQGTMGIVTWANIKMEYLPRINKIFFIPFIELDRAIEIIYQIQRKKIGYECFLLNQLNLSLIFESLDLKNRVSPYTVILVLSGPLRRPEEKIAYEENALKGIFKENPERVIESPLFLNPGLEKMITNILRGPWKEEAYWKFRFKGGCEPIFFITKPEKIPLFNEIVREVTPNFNYQIEEVGMYIQPVENGRACHCEFDLFYDPRSEGDKENVKSLVKALGRTLLDAGALFTRPPICLSDLIYERVPAYKIAIRKVKSIFDPNNIMCPGNLSF